MKKPLLAIGTIFAVTAPVVGAVSCTLIKQDTMKQYTKFSNYRSIGKIIESFDQNMGANIGISPWLSSFWKQRSNKLLGTLNYKSNNSGIIASNGFGKDDIRALSRLLEAQTWLEYAGYDAKSVDGTTNLPHTIKDEHGRVVEEYDMRLNDRTGSSVVNSVDDLELTKNSWLKDFNINYGQTYKENDTIKSYLNGKLREFKAWNTDDTESCFVKTNLFQVERASDVADTSKTEEEEIKYHLGKSADQKLSREDIKSFVHKQVMRLLGKEHETRYKFEQRHESEKINFYIAYNANANDDAKIYNKEDVTVSDSVHYNTLRTKISEWFKEFGINVNVISVPLDGEGAEAKSTVVIPTGPNAGKSFDLKTLSEIANSQEKALIYMPIDSWLNSGDPKGSLILQKRNQKTVGDQIFFGDNINDSIEMSEPKLMEQLYEVYATFADFVSGNDYTLLNFFDMVTLKTAEDPISKQVALTNAQAELNNLWTALNALKAEKLAANPALTDSQVNAMPDVAVLIEKIKVAEADVQAKWEKWEAEKENVAEWYATQLALKRDKYLSRWLNGGTNGFKDKAYAYRDDMKKLPVISEKTGNIDYRVQDYYTIYNTQYVFSPDITLKNESQRLFSQALDNNAPKASNNYNWNINVRSALPLPLVVGYTNDDDGSLRSNIQDWVNEHFVI